MAQNEFRTPDGDVENEVFVTESWLIDQWIGDELWIWGSNTNGLLGINNANVRSTPVTTFAGGSNWKQVSCGNFHTAAIKTDGSLWTWGQNTNGQLGNNTVVNRSTPVTTFAGGNNWKQVACGNLNTMAIKTDGTLWSWGSNYRGCLGTNGTTDRSIPVTTFAGGNDWKQVSSNAGTSAAIKTDGSLWIWGNNLDASNNPNGQLGTNDTVVRCTPVTTFAGGNNWKQVTCGGFNTVATKTDGTLWTWGNNSFGQLGINNFDNKSIPVQEFTLSNRWKQSSCNAYFMAAIKYDGTLWTWGSGSSGKLGTNNTQSQRTPVTTFAGGNDWRQVFCTNFQVLAIKTDGSLWTWGMQNGGPSLGTNDFIDRSTPVTTFAGGNNWKQAVGGNSHCAAVTSGPDIY